LLVSVPYAMKAAVADTLAGHSASEFVTTDDLQSAVLQLQGQATTVAAGAPAGTNSASTAAGLAPVPTNTATNFVDTTTNQVVLVQQNGRVLAGGGVRPTTLASSGR
jgi:trimeric autotransporter adhesin